MHIDARTLEDGSLIEGDLCIVGAGAAGITMAVEWSGRSQKVILLEGGGFDLDPDLQNLYRSEIVGEPYFPLEAARLHFFGGTTNHWAGFSSIMDPIDFEWRPWVPHSGWPIGRDDVMPFYARAHEYLDLGPFEYDASFWAAQHADNVLLPLDDEAVWTKMWHFSTPTRFGKKYRAAVVDAPNVHLYTHANVTQIEANEPVTATDGLRVRTFEGKEHRVRARTYVLACGAIQNARLLLSSNERAPRGLGNQHDLVGRYFMEHIEMPGARLALTARRPMRMYQFHYPESRYPSGELALSAEAQRENEVLNGTCSFRDAPPADEPLQGMFDRVPPDAVERMRIVEERDRAAQDQTEETVEGAAEYPTQYELFTRQEQAPNPNSRVTLSSERDALGVPRTRLDWQLTDLDKRSIRRFYEIVGRETGRSGVARVQLLDWLTEDGWPSFLGGGWHHMGTTRMAASPREGVVDPDCKVHDLDNLFVAGSAPFVTAGAVNPTLTLVALTLRLSDHLTNTLR